MKKILLTTFACFSLLSMSYGDTITMKDGSKYVGSIKSSDDQTIVFETPSGVLNLKRANISFIDTNQNGASREINTFYLKNGSVIKGSAENLSEPTIKVHTQDGVLNIDRNNVEKIVPVSVQGDSSLKAEQPQFTSKNDTRSVEVDFKAGYDFSGTHKVTNAKVCASGFDCLSFDGGSESTKTGFSISSDLYVYPTNNFGLGAGITYQTPRKQKNFDGDFHFVPVYGTIKLRTNANSSDPNFYVVGQLGYNGFYGDNDYKGTGGTLTGGLYAGIGAGIDWKNIIVEVLYTEDNGSIHQSIYIPALFTTANLSGDVKYTKTTLNFGYKFSL